MQSFTSQHAGLHIHVITRRTSQNIKQGITSQHAEHHIVIEALSRSEKDLTLFTLYMITLRVPKFMISLLMVLQLYRPFTSNICVPRIFYLFFCFTGILYESPKQALTAFFVWQTKSTLLSAFPQLPDFLLSFFEGFRFDLSLVSSILSENVVNAESTFINCPNEFLLLS